MEVNRHEPGAFCWVELGTTDHDGARAFYQSLFGWESNDIPMGPDNNYTIFHIGGRDVAALYQFQKEQQDQASNPHWLLYIAVENADQTAESVKAAGGKVLMGPADVSEEGRMLIATDPTGARFACWQPKKKSGVGLVNETSTMCWQELQIRDLESAGKFYTSVFGWTALSQGSGADTYVEFYIGDPAEHKTAGAMMAIREEWGNVPSNWSVYFSVDDCDASAAMATALGASLAVPPTDIPKVGRFSVIMDPQGAVFSIIKLIHH